MKVQSRTLLPTTVNNFIKASLKKNRDNFTRKSEDLQKSKLRVSTYILIHSANETSTSSVMEVEGVQGSREQTGFRLKVQISEGQ